MMLHICASFKLFSTILLRNPVRYFSSIHKHRPNSDILELALSFRMGKSKKHKTDESQKSPTQVYFHVISNGSTGEAKSLMLVTTLKRYVFQCSEGTQRLLSEHKLKINNIEAMFITHNSWNNVSGIAGVLLTIQESRSGAFTLCGPPNCATYLTDVQKFKIIEDIQIISPHYTETYNDGTLIVKSIPIYGSTVKVVERHKVDEALKRNWYTAKPMWIEEANDTDSAVDSDIKGKTRGKRTFDHTEMGKAELSAGKLAKAEHEDELALVYLGTLPDLPGKLLIEKCIEKKVPVGPLLAELKKGNNVTLQDGTVIKASDVTEPNILGESFLIVDCPNEDFLPSLTENEEILSLQSPTSATKLSVIAHLTSSKLLNTQEYRHWMERFPPNVKHFVLNEDCSGTGYVGMCKAQTWTNLISNDIYPLLPLLIEGDGAKKEDTSNITWPKPGLQIWMRPHKEMKETIVVDKEDFINELRTETPEIDKEIIDMKNELEKHAKIHDGEKSEDEGVESRYPEIIFLGTSSACPTKTRNVSSILVHTSEDTCMLMDAGEDTFGQLHRFYGSETEEVLRKLRCIFITHKHADHHMGMFRVMLEWSKVKPRPSTPLYITTPSTLSHWYEHCFKTYPELYSLITDGHLEFLTNFSLVKATNKNVESSVQILLHSLNLREYRTLYARHIFESYSIIITLKNGYKLVYSGDTLPNNLLANAGLLCDLLIHEATFGDEDYMLPMASLKKHCTQLQALEISEKMQAKFTILTHFSARFNKMPSHIFQQNLGFAFDMMKVNRRNVWQLPYLGKPLELMYFKYLEDMREKDERRALQQQLLENSKDEKQHADIK